MVDYQAGAAVNDLAERYRVSRMTVMRQVDRAGVPRRWRILQSADVEEACRLYASGLSLAKIAVKFGVHPSTIRRALVKAGAALRDAHGREQ